MEANFWNLKIAEFRLDRQTAQLKQALAQAKFDLREAKAKQLEYSGSFRSFLDKLSGKQEQQLYALHSEKARAEARLAECGQELGDVSQKLEDTRAMLDSLSPLPDCRGEARYCIECLDTLLPEADAALTELRTMMQGAVPGKITTIQEQQEIYGEADRRAAICSALLQSLESALREAGIPFSCPDCYRNPVAYLAGATNYTRRDRLNELIAQSAKLLSQLPKLSGQLKESGN